jgi:hypothetical protein
LSRPGPLGNAEALERLEALLVTLADPHHDLHGVPGIERGDIGSQALAGDIGYSLHCPVLQSDLRWAHGHAPHVFASDLNGRTAVRPHVFASDLNGRTAVRPHVFASDLNGRTAVRPYVFASDLNGRTAVRPYEL